MILDTHALLWWLTDNPALSTKVKAILTDAQTNIFVSSASIWELMIKHSLGRLVLPAEPAAFIREQLRENQFVALPIEIEHVLKLLGMPSFHRDPFDRILVAQAQVEKMPIISKDRLLRNYDVELVW